MKYAIVRLNKQLIAGLSTRTGNLEPDSRQKIGQVWQDFFSCWASQIPRVASPVPYGLYTNYESDVNGQYDMIVGLEVTEGISLPPELVSAVIPRGRYAKFCFAGDPMKDLQKFWTEVWNTPLERAYTCDFEKYPENGKIDIYIALK